LQNFVYRKIGFYHRKVSHLQNCCKLVIYPVPPGAKTCIDLGMKLERCQRKSHLGHLQPRHQTFKETHELKLSLNCNPPAISHFAAKCIFAPAWGYACGDPFQPTLHSACPCPGSTGQVPKMSAAVLRLSCKLVFSCRGLQGCCTAKAVLQIRADQGESVGVQPPPPRLIFEGPDGPEQPHLRFPCAQEHISALSLPWLYPSALAASSLLLLEGPSPGSCLCRGPC